MLRDFRLWNPEYFFNLQPRRGRSEFEITPRPSIQTRSKVQSTEDNLEILNYFQNKNQDSILPIAINLRRFKNEYYSVDGSRWTKATFFNWNDDTVEGIRWQYSYVNQCLHIFSETRDLVVNLGRSIEYVCIPGNKYRMAFCIKEVEALKSIQ